MKKTVIIIFLVCLQTNIFSQRTNYFSASTKYLTPSFQPVTAQDPKPDIKGIPTLFTTFEGSVSVLSWLRIGGFVNFNQENDKLINTALRVGIKYLEFSYETGNLQGSLQNSSLDLNGNTLDVPVGDFSNKFRSFTIFKTPTDFNEYYISQYGLGITSMTMPLQSTVGLTNIIEITYVDPFAKVNFYAFHQKIDMMYSRLASTMDTGKVKLDFSSSNLAGIVTMQASDFAKDELEDIVRNGLGNGQYDNLYADPNGFISSNRNSTWGFGISSDTRIGVSCIYKESDKKLSFGFSGGYNFRFYALLTAGESKDPIDNEYFQSAPSSTFLLQHGPYLKTQINW
ncbi:hypothetical protein [Polaribacter glomeratus]|uniref:DUF5723 domain-containing protein n=1 Tax=Polaribacter glomeratus TaxID=102 RepID=A0A2S7WGA5_9FLAO|nr:hypothetical protein [Polaribacter glomeratus]PQJ76446.1 hypothetical protein BTO16_11080 [Polaribacter glomeratus]TXD65580.1 hypothetical protein ESX12_10385 [Polaribacter glomeratus]